MSVIRVEKNKNYTVMSNIHLRDKNLSLKAKGLLSMMLSLPEEWDYSIAGLCSICKESETAIKSSLKELKENGYVVIDKKYPTKENGGRFEYEYIVYESPVKSEKQDGEKQGVENQPVETLEVDSVPQLNTNISNKDKLNKEKEKYIYRATSSLDMDFDEEILRKASSITSSATLLDGINYYLKKYRRTFNRPHPDVTVSALEVIIENITDVLEDVFYEVIDTDGITRMIDRHFKTNYGHPIDYKINHFGTKGIIEFQARNCGLITGKGNFHV